MKELPFGEDDVSRNIANVIWEGIEAIPADVGKDFTRLILDPDAEVSVRLERDPPDHFVVFVNGHRVVRKHKLSVMKPSRVIQN